MVLFGKYAGQLRYQLWWLARLTWRVVLVVLLGGVVWMGTATAPAAQATKWIRLGVPFTRQLPYTVMIIVCAGA
jgi:hypothetical protein